MLFFICVLIAFIQHTNACNDQHPRRHRMNDMYDAWHRRTGPPVANERKVFLLSMDGFRWDYMYRIRRLIGEKESNLWQLLKGAAYAPAGITSTFATLTFPNHYTMVTGLYQEHHGVISNSFYDSSTGKTYTLKTDEDTSAIYGGEPIWKRLMDQNQDGRPVVACSMWGACQYGGFDDQHFIKLDKTRKSYFSQYKHVRVIDKEDGPKVWHYKTSPRISQLLVMPDPGFTLSPGGGSFEHKGSHGYDNRLGVMKPIFIAHGPAFKQGPIVDGDMSTADIYLLMCVIMKVEPAKNDGNPIYYKDFVRERFLKQLPSVAAQLGLSESD